MSRVDANLTNEPVAPSGAVHRRKRVGPRAALIAGFSALLVLMAMLAFDAIGSLRELEASSSQVRRDYLSRERTLRKIRTTLNNSGNLLRDFSLSDSNPLIRESYLAQLHDMRDHASAAMQSSLAQSSPNLEDPLRKLANELDNYWLAVDHTMTAEVHEKNRAVLHRAALAQRSAVLAITSEVSDVNDLELRQAEQEISSVFDRSRARLLNFSALAIGIGLVLAAATFFYVTHLEDRAEEKYLESVRYQGELKELSKCLDDAHEEERRAISRELHDQIAQTLTALLMNVQDLMDRPQPFNSSGEALQKIRLQAADCVNKVRNMALLLRPSMLDDFGLLAAVEWQGREISKRTGLVVEVMDHNFDDDLPDDHKTCIYRVVQEALNNCTAHAKATHARVLLTGGARHYVLSISDDGIGFDPARKFGMGLLGMQERVARLGGTFLVESAPGRGTSIRVELPVAHSSPTEILVL